MSNLFSVDQDYSMREIKIILHDEVKRVLRDAGRKEARALDRVKALTTAKAGRDRREQMARMRRKKGS